MCATDNAIVSPPIFTIPPGGRQLIRIGLKDRNAAKAYRVIAEEIPLQKPGPGQVQVLLRLNLPLYLLPRTPAKAEVAWRAWRSRDGGMVLEGRNSGTLHQQVTEIDADQDGRSQVLTKEMGVLLPGAARQWKLASSVQLQPGIPATLKVRSPSGDAHAQIILEPR